MRFSDCLNRQQVLDELDRRLELAKRSTSKQRRNLKTSAALDRAANRLAELAGDPLPRGDSTTSEGLFLSEVEWAKRAEARRWNGADGDILDDRVKPLFYRSDNANPASLDYDHPITVTLPKERQGWYKVTLGYDHLGNPITRQEPVAIRKVDMSVVDILRLVAAECPSTIPCRVVEKPVQFWHSPLPADGRVSHPVLTVAAHPRRGPAETAGRVLESLLRQECARHIWGKRAPLSLTGRSGQLALNA